MVTPSPRVITGGLMSGPCRAKCSQRLSVMLQVSLTLGSMARLLLAPFGARRRQARLMAMTSAQQVTEFEALRPHLMSVAYRLTGTVADAEDIVQEAWLRWDSAGGRGPIAHLPARLTP